VRSCPAIYEYARTGRFRDLSKIPGGSEAGVPGEEQSQPAASSGIQEQQGKYDSKADGLKKPNNRDDNDR